MPLIRAATMDHFKVSEWLLEPVYTIPGRSWKLGPLNENNIINWQSGSPYELVGDLGRRIARLSGDDRERSFLFQRLSVVVQRFNSMLLHDRFFRLMITRISSHSSLTLFLQFLKSRDLRPGLKMIIIKW